MTRDPRIQERSSGPFVRTSRGPWRGFSSLPDGSHDEFVGAFPRRIVRVRGTAYECPRCRRVEPQWVTDEEIWDRLPRTWLRDHPGGGTLCVPCFVDLVKGQSLWRVVDPRESGLPRGSVITGERLDALREEMGDDALVVQRCAETIRRWARR